jgi:hypothetical protein
MLFNGLPVLIKLVLFFKSVESRLAALNYFKLKISASIMEECRMACQSLRLNAFMRLCVYEWWGLFSVTGCRSGS